jgi:thiamine-phosphate pyrophosphorylase
MDLVLITSPEDFAGEHETIETMLQCGIPTVHVRKPGKSERQLEQWLLGFGLEWLPRFVLHGHPNLYHSLGHLAKGGIHFNTQFPAQDYPATPAKSMAVHSLQELQTIAQSAHIPEYVLLSPVFPSISKPGYQQPALLQQIQALPTNWTTQYPFKVYALGGIDTDTLATVAQLGLDGVAVLGAVWNSIDHLNAAFGLAEQCGYTITWPEWLQRFKHNEDY